MRRVATGARHTVDACCHIRSVTLSGQRKPQVFARVVGLLARTFSDQQMKQETHAYSCDLSCVVVDLRLLGFAMMHQQPQSLSCRRVTS